MINSINGTKMENSGLDFAVCELQNKRWQSPAQLEEFCRDKTTFYTKRINEVIKRPRKLCAL
jgi:hypothetical protein